jgi:hypothetical protein
MKFSELLLSLKSIIKFQNEKSFAVSNFSLKVTGFYRRNKFFVFLQYFFIFSNMFAYFSKTFFVVRNHHKNISAALEAFGMSLITVIGLVKALTLKLSFEKFIRLRENIQEQNEEGLKMELFTNFVTL